jgi:hypothetical protein
MNYQMNFEATLKCVDKGTSPRKKSMLTIFTYTRTYVSNVVG